ncbi:Biotin carboxyl carrier protein of acetyl-CoA carboxylase [hydrothermal vent metagenome]|uniref:Biotin carboxyl carrier protein of acetyl-CoA carboxylase n=1 Tax=hydrothermal vent metagenome TaxID=652676 RepID=A0A3B0TLP1_9ZZZZ
MTDKKTVDRDLIRDLANILDETELTEIEIEQHGIRVRVQRMPGQVAPAAAALAHPTAPVPAAQGADKPADMPNHPGTVTSPMVGTAFRSAEPGAPTFVEIGAMVAEGQTVLIVEAMKTFNPIVAPRAGKITAILVEDGQPVEFGEPLLIIE